MPTAFDKTEYEGCTPVRVSEVNNYVKRCFDNNKWLRALCVVGEVSNYKGVNRNGNAYFSLKDENGTTLGVTLFGAAGVYGAAGFELRDGLKILVYGGCTLYEKTGTFQLIGKIIELDGIGKLYAEFELLKKKLGAMGLFDAAHKKKIPFLPKRVGLITSPTGAAVEDVKKTISLRFPGMPVKLYPCPVQGANAPPMIIKALKAAVSENICDVLILTRGGGTYDELFVYNDEALAFEIYNCPIPIIAAIGHEVDNTIAEFVSDLRAATPTAAAQQAVPDKNKLVSDLAMCRNRLKNAGTRTTLLNRAGLMNLKASPFLKNPLGICDQARANLDGISIIMDRKLEGLISLKRRSFSYTLDKFRTFDIRNRLNGKKIDLGECRLRLTAQGRETLNSGTNSLAYLGGKLEALGPRNVLKRGYAIISDASGAVKTSAAEVAPGEELNVTVSDGIIKTKVTGVQL